jgi:predicted ribosomally synthesized peptide with SipW-like signal peptide
MPLSRPLVVLAGVAIAGVALVGVGASASFTDSTSSAQKITAGNMNVVVSASNVPGCETATNGCKSLSLPDVGPVGASFESPATHVVVTNNGNVAAYFDAMQMSESDNGSTASVTLRNEVNICIRSNDNSGTWVEGNGPLTTAVALHPTVKQNAVKLDPGQSASYWFSLYAGQNSAECGTTSSDGSNTRAAWDGYDGGAYHTPASLTDAAQGGSVTPKLTFSFTG